MNTFKEFGFRRRPFSLPFWLHFALCHAAVASIGSAAILTECSENALRAAVADGGLITLSCGGVYLVPSTLNITRNTTINATASPVVLSGGWGTRVFYVGPGAELKLVGITIRDGFSTNGAAIYNDGGKVTLIDCVLATNQVIGLAGTSGTDGVPGTAGTPGGPGEPGMEASGGAIFNAGIMLVTNTAFLGNRASGGDGGSGGVGGDSASQVDPFGRCRSEGSRGGGAGSKGANGFGGAIFNLGLLVMHDATLAGNKASGGAGGQGGSVGRVPCIPIGPGENAGNGGSGGDGDGGAIYSTGILGMGACTLFANEAEGSVGGVGGVGNPASLQLDGFAGASGRGVGGAVSNVGSNRLVNVTMANNLAQGGACAKAEGGAIANMGSLWMTNCTIWLNVALAGTTASECGVAPQSAGSAISTSSNGFTYLVNTIIGAHQATNSSAGHVIDGGRNLCSDNSAALSAPGSLNNAGPMLGPLAANGGRTFTMGLLPGSPALDAGDDSKSSSVDQRGVVRPSGAASDIGAFEGSDGIAYPLIKQFYAPSEVSYPGPAWLNVWISNACPVTLSNLVISSQLASNFSTLSGEGLVTDCSGNVQFTSSNLTLIVSRMSLAPGQACSFSMPVRPPGVCGLVTNSPAMLASPDFYPPVSSSPCELLVRRPEMSRNAIRLDGEDDLILGQDRNNFATIYRSTVSLWFRTTTKVGGGMLGRYDTNSNRADQHIYMEDSGRLAVGVATTGGIGEQVSVSPKSYNDGQWHWVVASFSQPGVKLHVDGELVSSSPTASVAYFLTGAWTIGFLPLNSHSNRPTSNFFAGEVDDIQVWNRDRAEAELKFDFKQSLCGTEPGLYLYWRAEEGQGTRLFNSGPVERGAVLYGNPQWIFPGAPVVASDLIRRLAGTGVKVQSWGPAESLAVLKASTNLLNWEPVATNRAAMDGLATFIETNTALPRRFYRVQP